MNSWVNISDWLEIKISGSQTIEYLNGIVTRDITLIKNNEFARSAFLTHKGKIKSVFWVTKNQQNEVLLFCHPMMKNNLIEDLLKYKLNMDVKLEDVSSDTDNLYLVNSDKLIQGLSLGDSHLIFKHSKNKPKGNEINKFKFDSILIQNGILPSQFMIDLNPIETGVFDMIDLDKGCFLGQEPVSRMYHRGNPRKYLYHLQIDPDQSIDINSPIKIKNDIIGNIIAVYQNHAIGFINRQVTEFNNIQILNQKLNYISKVGNYPIYNRK